MGMTIDTRGVTRALDRWVTLTAKDAGKAVNLAMRLWTSFTYKNISEAGAAKIRAELLAKRPGRKTRSRSIYTNTLASRIVASKVKKGKIPPFQNEVDFNKAVRKFVGNRVRSSGYHRSGMIPALKEFRVGGKRGRGGRFKNPPAGRAKKAPLQRKLSRKDIKGFFENFARSFVRIQGGVVGRQLPAVEKQIKKFLLEDLLSNKRKSGFK